MAQFALRPDQVTDLAFHIANPRSMNLSDPGTGKTPTTCVYIEYLFKHLNCKTAWVMPKSLLWKNKQEFVKFTNLTDEQVIIVDGTPKEREEQMNDPKGVVFLMGFKRWSDEWQTFLKIHPTMLALVGDEWHMGGYKNPNSKRSEELFKSMRKMQYFLPMSGTMISGRLDSCYVPIKVIEPRYYANHFSFLAQHAVKDDYGNLIGWLNHEKLGRIFMRHGVRHTFEEIYGKVNKVFIKEKVVMDKKSRDAYDEFEEMAILELEAAFNKEGDTFIEAINGAVNAIRCRQIMAHPHTFSLLKEDELTGKEEALQIHVEDHLNTGAPLIVYASLIPEQERIAKLLAKWGMRVGLINSNVTPHKRGLIDEDFRAGKLNAVVGSPATMAVGYNWPHVDHVIFASMGYLDDDFTQGYKRAVRGKRQRPLRITILEYIKSIDHRVLMIVDKKSREKHKVDSTYEVLHLSTLDVDTA